MGDLLKFIKSKQFLLHFGIALGTLLIILFVLIKFLSSYTGHNEFVEVPDFSDKTVFELKAFIEGKEVNYIIVDSVYDPSKKPGVVLKQDPLAKTKVKHNRNIYLYVTSIVPPQVIMPKLQDRSERQAKLIINSYGLKVGKVITKSADCNGCVMEQLYKGKTIEPGTGIKKGSVIDLVVGIKEYYYNASNDTTATKDEGFKDEE